MNLNRKIKPDFIYNSQLVARIINKIMLNGNKSIAEKIFYSAFSKILDDVKSDSQQFHLDGLEENDRNSPVKVLEFILSKITPTVELRSKRVGGSNYNIPCPVDQKRGLSIAINWLISAFRSRNEKTAIDRLVKEMYDILSNRGTAVKSMLDNKKMAEANKAFSHLLNGKKK
ncbi:30S ribosomal protein S7 [Candidatus Deianiraea vastatrix]|uniref:Small ribosomal subunit protein uS7 n=1 Tax=Candidatus Deianiraea vastatrix TaxID=2163644 RepID=A0A5B8XEM4_9RICK|nr:30S ribosomal protein S7 [Candidatus Deianiraea vastatrix]QED23416.1 30S ribosomal protein S7 [Candidatus Deianiraea vastatrix]